MTTVSVTMDSADPDRVHRVGDRKRLTLALPFKYQEKWIGGLYYVRSLVSALGLLPAEFRPKLVIVDDDTQGLEYLVKATGYPDLHRVEAGTFARASGSPGALRAYLAGTKRTEDPTVDVVLLGSIRGLEHRAVQWIPDFQEERFPEFFRPGEIHARRRLNSRSLAKHRHVMVSSEDARSDLELYYGKNRNRIHVVRFASFADTESAGASLAELRERYRLPQRFFICNNQIWLHKNHALVLRALAQSAVDGEAPAIVFTGQEHDYRDRAYAPSIKALAGELGIDEKTHFLGFLPRADQLGLVSAAIAVIQPSLCEGWSGVVEDAKALGKHVLASDIAVHREQLAVNVDFFSPTDVAGLSRLLQRYRDADPKVRPVDYGQARQDFARSLLRMLTEVASDSGEDREGRGQGPADPRP